MVLENCDKDVYENGKAVMVTHTIPAAKIDQWVKKVAELSGQKVDWHYMGGRAVIRALGDLDAVDAVIQELLPEHDKLYIAEAMTFSHNQDHPDLIQPPRWFPHKENNNE